MKSMGSQEKNPREGKKHPEPSLRYFMSQGDQSELH